MKLFEKAYARLLELYNGKNCTPNPIILSRFYREKMLLSEGYMRLLDLVSKVREAAEQKGEHVFVSGTVGASFIAYLLGATDINPLPRQEYCPNCHNVKFVGCGTPFDSAPIRCSCSTAIVTDGHDLPFEMNLRSVFAERIQLCVSHAFLDEAKSMICDDAITIVPDESLDRCRELEKATGFKMKDIGFEEQSLAFLRFMGRDIDGIPHFDSRFISELWDTVKPQSYDDLLKFIGFAHSTDVWNNNAEKFFREHRMTLREIPAYREDLFEMISDKLHQKGIYDDALAYEVTNQALHGQYAKNGDVDEVTMLTLSELGFDMDFVFFLSGIEYMFTKAQGITYLREAIAMMFYKTKYNKEYREIMFACE